MNKVYNYIYKTTCTVTGRYYIGMHSTNKLNDGYLGSGKRLRYSIRKYGKDKHIKEILEYCDCRESLAKREEEIIADQYLTEKLCMNLRKGGRGGFHPDISRKGNKRATQRTKEMWSEKNNWTESKRKEQSLRTKQMHQAGVFSHKLPSFKGKKHSETTKEKMRKSKGIGNTNSQFGSCWINKEGEYKKIKIADLPKFISNGWIKGRSGFKNNT